MKIILLAAALLVTGIARGEYSREFIKAMRKGADTFVEITVVDDDGLSVSNALVSVCYNIGSGREETHGPTDGGGKYLFKKRTNGYGEIDVTKEGFYRSESSFSFIDMGREHEVVDGVWLPNPQPLKILLRPIKNPTKLVSCNQWFDVPSTNQWIAFDMLMKDWLAPYGTGKVEDFSIFFIWDGKKPNEGSSVALNLRFPQSVPCAYTQHLHHNSKFPWSYHADTNQFSTTYYHWEYRKDNGRLIDNRMSKSDELIFRTRCSTNPVTKEVSYSYARFYQFLFAGGWRGKGGVGLYYDINPTPNDTNLEPKR